MARSKIKSLRIRGLRTIADLELRFDGLTVLVGDNGSGKSSILEALELCRRIGNGDLFGSLDAIHGGVGSLLRHQEKFLELTVEVELVAATDPPDTARYVLGLGSNTRRPTINEHLELWSPEDSEERLLFLRVNAEAKLWDGKELTPLIRSNSTKHIRGDLLLNELSGPLSPHPAIDAVQEALAAIEVHLPFEVTPTWAARAHQRSSAARGSVLLQPADRLAQFGGNLANVFHTLRNERPREHWDTTMDFVRMGLGANIESVNTRADAGGGAIAIALELADQSELLPAYALSDGQLAWLCFVALYRLESERSLLAFDEPELHMHPELLVRVVQLFEDMARTHPVILATHSDVLLDALTDPAKSVRVCELEAGATQLRQLDESALRKWMERYRGVGHLRAEGYLPGLLRDDAGDGGESGGAAP